MELGKNLKALRNHKNLSQDELADMVYVSRQTISNWENDKNYPDIHSLLLLANVFDITIDQLLKQDKQQIEEYVKSEDIHSFKQISIVFFILLCASIITPLPLVHFLGLFGFIIWILIYVATLYTAIRADKLKKDLSLNTYKEIIAFMEGKHLDEIDTYREQGKKTYQQAFYVIAIAIITLMINIIILIFIK